MDPIYLRYTIGTSINERSIAKCHEEIKSSNLNGLMIDIHQDIVNKIYNQVIGLNSNYLFQLKKDLS
jgi:hypothetical protein